jgi:hypothetical protein
MSKEQDAQVAAFRTRLLDAVLVGQHDEWAEGRRYFALEVLTRARLNVITTTDLEQTEEFSARVRVRPNGARLGATLVLQEVVGSRSRGATWTACDNC